MFPILSRNSPSFSKRRNLSTYRYRYRYSGCGHLLFHVKFRNFLEMFTKFVQVSSLFRMQIAIFTRNFSKCSRNVYEILYPPYSGCGQLYSPGGQNSSSWPDGDSTLTSLRYIVVLICTPKEIGSSVADPKESYRFGRILIQIKPTVLFVWKGCSQ
jgi:hypothetical protein